MRVVTAVVAGVAVLAGAAPAMAQTADERIAACIANNSARYGEPSSATVAQYFSVASACRASVQGRPGIDVVLSPDAPTAPDSESSSGGISAPGSGEAGGTSPTAPAGSPASSSPGSSSSSGTPSIPDGSSTAKAATSEQTARLVRGALASNQSSGTSIASPVGALTPVGAGSLVAAALVGVGGFMLRRRYSG